MSSLDVYVLTFNCGRETIKPEIFAPQLLNATSTAPDLLVLCLQEIAPIGYAFLGGSFLTPYFKAFRSAVKLARDGYVNIIARNVGLTAIMVFAKQDVASDIRWLQTGAVGVGYSETGNKGAVGVRLGYGTGDEVTQMTFVSAHLAPMEDGLERRNEDYRSIAERLVFESDPSNSTADPSEETPLLQETSSGSSGKSKHSGIYHPSSHLFFAGDLNYRTSSVSPSPEDVQSFPQPTKDPKSPSHYSHLLTKDQLTQQMKEGKTLHGLQEAPIDFPPTYKYRSKGDITLDSEQHWNWASHRWPSWCDRIFYSPTNIKAQSYQALPLFGTSDHRPVALSVSVPLGPVKNAFQEPSIPFSIDPEWRAKRDAARRKEVMFGFLAYLAWTYEGEGMVLASTIGALGGWLILRSILMS